MAPDDGDPLMQEMCKLRQANGAEGVECDEERCVYWRLVEHLDAGDGVGCAVQHFELLDSGEEIAAWLLSVKERVEGNATGDGS